MNALVRYDALCRQVAEAATVDDAINLANKADALRLLARKAGNRDLEISAAEIRLRAERRLGQLVAKMRDGGQLHRGGRPKSNSVRGEQLPTLRELGVDKKLAHRARRMARVTDPAFEKLLDGWRRSVREQRRAAVGVKLSVRSLRDLSALDSVKLGNGRPVGSVLFGHARTIARELRALAGALDAICDQYRNANSGARMHEIVSSEEFERLHAAAREREDTK